MIGVYWYGAAKAFPRGAALVSLLRELKGYGVNRYIPQWGRDEAAKYVIAADVRAVCAGEGIELVLGMGLDTSTDRDPMAHARLVSASILRNLELRVPLNLDWEGWWDGKRTAGAYVADTVLRSRPDAPLWCVDCPWWAPSFTIDRETGRKRWTHPSAPTLEFGRIVGSRYPQAYGAQADGSPEGRSLAMLAWSRSPTQYAAIASGAGCLPWPIFPTTQAYARSLNDQINTLLREPEQNVWTYNQASGEFKTALAVVVALAQAGYTGASAVIDFQLATGLEADGVVGPLTLAKLGVKPQKGVSRRT